MINVTAIFGSPRSGTTWLGQLFNSSPEVAYRFQPLFSHAFKNSISEHSSSIEIEKFYADILTTEDEFVMQKRNVSNNENLVFAKESITHLVWKEVRYHYVIENLLKNSNSKVVGIIRHPCAVLWSWLNAPKEFNKEWNVLDEWRFAKAKNLNRREEYNGYEKWKEIAFDFIRFQSEFPRRFSLIKYEALNLNTIEVVRKLFKFSGIKWNGQTEQFILDSKSSNDNDPYGVRKKDKPNEEWRHKLPVSIETEILKDPDFIQLNAFYKWVPKS